MTTEKTEQSVLRVAKWLGSKPEERQELYQFAFEQAYGETSGDVDKSLEMADEFVKYAWEHKELFINKYPVQVLWRIVGRTDAKSCPNCEKLNDKVFEEDAKDYIDSLKLKIGHEGCKHSWVKVVAHKGKVYNLSDVQDMGLI